MSQRLIYLIAGEPSGDRLGAALMTALRAEAGPEIAFAGVGGRRMAEAGLVPLFDIDDLAVMGLVEVLPRLRTLTRRLRQTTADVLAQSPAALITIDSPGFSLRVAARVRRARPGLRTIHYVAPSVWAWRPGRAAHMARFIDHVLALLPFEPAYMQAAGMSCDFVGHPVAERPVPTPQRAAAFRAAHGIAADAPALLLAPGSRRGEVARLLPPFLEVVRAIAPQLPGLRLIVPLAETVAGEVTARLAGLDPAPVPIAPETAEADRLAGFAAADAALVASGTVTLEMAAAGTPMVAAYRTNWLTAQIVRRLIRVNSANLVNLLAEGNPVPEFLQEFSTIEAMAGALLPLFRDGPERAAQKAAFDAVLATLGRGAEPPSRRAAKSVLAFLDLLDRAPSGG